jgi:predicted Holliday junction resolvase-like endonuclease
MKKKILITIIIENIVIINIVSYWLNLQNKFTQQTKQIYTTNKTNLHNKQNKFTQQTKQIYTINKTNLHNKQNKFTQQTKQIYTTNKTNLQK